MQGLEQLAEEAGFDQARIAEFKQELSQNEAFATIAYVEENGTEKPVAFYISRRVDHILLEKRDERFHKRMDAVRKAIQELEKKTDEELASIVADSGNAFVLEEYRGKGVGKALYAGHEQDAKKLGYAYKIEAARAPDEEGDAQRILLKLNYIQLGELGYTGRRYNKPLHGFLKKL